MVAGPFPLFLNHNPFVSVLVWNQNDMKKLFLTVLLTLLVSIPSLQAIPAHKGSVTINQPDGTTVTIRLHGDEYLHFTTTDDGYSVVKNEQGYYVYAQRGKDGQLEPTHMVAHDTALRQQAERQYLQGIAKYQAPDMTQDARKEMMAERARQQQTRRAAVAGAPKYDYNNFRGLVILVEYKDKSFSRDDYSEIITDMINKEGYTGYKNTNGRNVNCTGSVRDYFSDNSDGQFQPEFDVFGPYQINYSQYDARGGNNANALLNAVVRQADDDIDFSDYDRDGDGVVDMIYFIFAGNGANYSGNDSRLWWPHRSAVVSSDYRSYLEKDGVILWDYASSVELYGYTAYPQTVTIDGIGTICHEFSHVLGLPDFYDADYEQGGGQSHDPGEWSVMAGGSYNNNGRTPVGYTLFERYAVGFATPEVINATGSYTLENVAKTNSGYRINSNDDNEFFFLENRQQSGWDTYLPGHGMLVFRVDSSSVDIWDRNEVNNNPKHNYFELVRANGWQGQGSGADPFPGTRSVRTLNNETSPANLMTWTKKTTPWGLENIRESNGVVTFDIVDVNILSKLSFDVEQVELGVGFTYQFEPVRSPESAPFSFTWSSSDTDVATVSEGGVVTGVAEGSATITVKDTNTGVTASVVVNVFVPKTAENVAGFKAFVEGDNAELQLQDAQVLHVYNKDVYVRDASGSILLADAHLPELKSGDVVSGAVYGQLAVVNEVARLAGVDNSDNSSAVTVLSSDNEIEPRTVELSELTADDYSDLITFSGVELHRLTTAEAYNGLTGYFLIEGDTYVRLYNTFKLPANSITMPSKYEGKRFDVTGILTTTLSKGVVVKELGLLRSIVETVEKQPEDPEVSAISTVVTEQQRQFFTLDGMPVKQLTSPGLYIVRQGGITKKILY